MGTMCAIYGCPVEASAEAIDPNSRNLRVTAFLRRCKVIGRREAEFSETISFYSLNHISTANHETQRLAVRLTCLILEKMKSHLTQARINLRQSSSTGGHRIPFQLIAGQNGREESGTSPEKMCLGIILRGNQKACQFAQRVGIYRLPADNQVTGDFGLEGMRYRIVRAVIEDQRAGSALNLAFQKVRTHHGAERVFL